MKKDVSILMGSKNDWDVMKECAEALDFFKIVYDVNVLSAHRAPQLVIDHVRKSEENGVGVFICGAGGAAHLAGLVAANTALPVLGIPVAAGALNGMDALLATVQMPRGIPVGTVAINGAYNAGLLAVQILSLGNKDLKEKLKKFKEDLEKKVVQASESLQKEIKK